MAGSPRTKLFVKHSHLSQCVAAFSIEHDATTKKAPTAASEGGPRSAYVSRSHRDPYGSAEQADDPHRANGVRIEAKPTIVR